MIHETFKVPFMALRAILFTSTDVDRPNLQFVRFEQLEPIGAGDLERIAAIATNGHVLIVVRWPGKLKESTHIHRDDIERALKLGTHGDRRKTMFEIGSDYIKLGELGTVPRCVNWELTYPDWCQIVPNISNERWEVERVGIDSQYLSLPAEHLKGILGAGVPLAIALPPDKWGPIRLDCNVEDDAKTFLDITYIIMPVRLD